MNGTPKLGIVISLLGLAVVGTLAVLLLAGVLGHPASSGGATPWWGPVSSWGLLGTLTAVACATVVLLFLGALTAVRTFLREGPARRPRPALFTSRDAVAVLDQLTGRADGGF